MRLVDADALMENVEDHVTTVSVCPTVDWSMGKTQMKKTILDDIRDAPTVDAIPIDWLTERINETANSPNDNDIKLNHALFWTSVEWERWKKENAVDRR